MKRLRVGEASNTIPLVCGGLLIACLGCSQLIGELGLRGLRGGTSTSKPLTSTRAMPPDVATEIQQNALAIDSVATIRASESPDSEAQYGEMVRDLAMQMQPYLDQELSLARLESYVRQAVNEAAERPEVRQRGRDHLRGQAMRTRLTPFNQAVFDRSDALQAALERERPELLRAAALVNDRETADEGDALCETLAERISQQLDPPMDQRHVLMHVTMEVRKAQGQSLKASDGTMMDAIRAHSTGNLKTVLDRTGKITTAALSQAIQDAASGKPERAVPILRNEFERTRALFQLSPWQRYEHDRQARLLYFMSERTRDLALTVVAGSPQSAELVELAYQVALAHRGRNPEVERRVSAALAETQGLSEVLASWRAARERVAATELQRAAGYVPSASEERGLAEARQSELELARRLDELAAVGRIQDAPFYADPGVAALQGALSSDTALVSFVAYREMSLTDPDYTRWPRRYGCFVLTSSALSWVPLGSAEELDRQVDSYVDAISSPDLELSKKQEKAAEFYRVAISPLSMALLGKRELIVVADGSLQLAPLQAAHDGTRWLADTYDISYELTERQLLGEHEPPNHGGPALIISGSPYGRERSKLENGQRLERGHFSELEHLEGEVRRVQQLLPDAELVGASAATDTVLSQKAAPRILHIAAHGVYLPLRNAADASGRGLAVVDAVAKPERQRTKKLRHEDPVAMSRSALVLWPSAEPASDGFLTAFEMATLNLWGTELAVLSACETGRGLADEARGVQGLRRALFAAGARSVVTSLWSADDAATSKLMTRFYEGVVAGLGRAQALRQASDEVRGANPDPMAWAPFILIGHRGPLGQSYLPSAEDDESRFRRAMAQRRSRHSVTAMGAAHWQLSGAKFEAVDALVQRHPQDHNPLSLTLLGRTQSLSLRVPDYVGAGEYTRMTVRTAPVRDSLTADIRTIVDDAAPLGVVSARLDVSIDTLQDGFKGRFEVTLADGRALSGEFALASGLPPAPAWMIESMRTGPRTAPRSGSEK